MIPRKLSQFIALLLCAAMVLTSVPAEAFQEIRSQRSEVRSKRISAPTSDLLLPTSFFAEQALTGTLIAGFIGLGMMHASAIDLRHSAGVLLGILTASVAMAALSAHGPESGDPENFLVKLYRDRGGRAKKLISETLDNLSPDVAFCWAQSLRVLRARWSPGRGTSHHLGYEGQDSQGRTIHTLVVHDDQKIESVAIAPERFLGEQPLVYHALSRDIGVPIASLLMSRPVMIQQYSKTWTFGSWAQTPEDRTRLEVALRDHPVVRNFVAYWVYRGVRPNLTGQIIHFAARRVATAYHFGLNNSIYRDPAALPDNVFVFVHEFIHAVYDKLSAAQKNAIEKHFHARHPDFIHLFKDGSVYEGKEADYATEALAYHLSMALLGQSSYLVKEGPLLHLTEADIAFFISLRVIPPSLVSAVYAVMGIKVITPITHQPDPFYFKRLVAEARANAKDPLAADLLKMALDTLTQRALPMGELQVNALGVPKVLLYRQRILAYALLIWLAENPGRPAGKAGFDTDMVEIYRDLVLDTRLHEWVEWLLHDMTTYDSFEKHLLALYISSTHHQEVEMFTGHPWRCVLDPHRAVRAVRLFDQLWTDSEIPETVAEAFAALAADMQDGFEPAHIEMRDDAGPLTEWFGDEEDNAPSRTFEKPTLESLLWQFDSAEEAGREIREQADNALLMLNQWGRQDDIVWLLASWAPALLDVPFFEELIHSPVFRTLGFVAEPHELPVAQAFIEPDPARESPYLAESIEPFYIVMMQNLLQFAKTLGRRGQQTGADVRAIPSTGIVASAKLARLFQEDRSLLLFGKFPSQSKQRWHHPSRRTTHHAVVLFEGEDETLDDALRYVSRTFGLILGIADLRTVPQLARMPVSGGLLGDLADSLIIIRQADDGDDDFAPEDGPDLIDTLGRGPLVPYGMLSDSPWGKLFYEVRAGGERLGELLKESVIQILLQEFPIIDAFIHAGDMKGLADYLKFEVSVLMETEVFFMLPAEGLIEELQDLVFATYDDAHEFIQWRVIDMVIGAADRHTWAFKRGILELVRLRDWEILALADDMEQWTPPLVPWLMGYALYEIPLYAVAAAVSGQPSLSDADRLRRPLSEEREAVFIQLAAAHREYQERVDRGDPGYAHKPYGMVPEPGDGRKHIDLEYAKDFPEDVIQRVSQILLHPSFADHRRFFHPDIPVRLVVVEPADIQSILQQFRVGDDASQDLESFHGLGYVYPRGQNQFTLVFAMTREGWDKTVMMTEMITGFLAKPDLGDPTSLQETLRSGQRPLTDDSDYKQESIIEFLETLQRDPASLDSENQEVLARTIEYHRSQFEEKRRLKNILGGWDKALLIFAFLTGGALLGLPGSSAWAQVAGKTKAPVQGPWWDAPLALLIVFIVAGIPIVRAVKRLLPHLRRGSPFRAELVQAAADFKKTKVARQWNRLKSLLSRNSSRYARELGDDALAASEQSDRSAPPETPGDGRTPDQVKQDIAKILENSRAEGATSQERMAAWNQTFDELALLLERSNAERKTYHQTFLDIERLLWAELRAGAPPLGAHHARDRFQGWMRGLVSAGSDLRGHPFTFWFSPLEYLLPSATHRRRIHPKDLLSHAIAAFVLGWRELPVSLVHDWSSRRPHHRDRVHLALISLHTPFMPQIEELIHALDLALAHPDLLKRHFLIGEFAHCLRYIARHHELLGSPDHKANTLAILIRLQEELRHGSTEIKTYAYRAPTEALKRLTRLADARETRLEVALIDPRDRDVLPGEDWKLLIAKYLRRVPEGLLAHCMIAARISLERTPRNARKAFSASWGDYRASSAIQAALRKILLPRRLLELWLHGPGDVYYQISPEQMAEVHERRQFTRDKMAAGLETVAEALQTFEHPKVKTIVGHFHHMAERLTSEEAGHHVRSKEFRALEKDINSLFGMRPDAPVSRELSKVRDYIHLLERNLSSKVRLRTAWEPIETAFFSLGNSSLDFVGDNYDPRYLEPYLNHPRLRALLAYQDNGEGSLGHRIGMMAVALSDQNEIVGICVPTKRNTDFDLSEAFVQYLKRWSQATGFPVILPEIPESKWAAAAQREGYQFRLKPYTVTIAATGNQEDPPMILHSDLTLNNPEFPISRTVDKGYWYYDPAASSEPEIRQQGFKIPMILAFLTGGALLSTTAQAAEKVVTQAHSAINWGPLAAVLAVGVGGAVAMATLGGGGAEPDDTPPNIIQKVQDFIRQKRFEEALDFITLKLQEMPHNAFLLRKQADTLVDYAYETGDKRILLRHARIALLYAQQAVRWERRRTPGVTRDLQRALTVLARCYFYVHEYALAFDTATEAFTLNPKQGVLALFYKRKANAQRLSPRADVPPLFHRRVMPHDLPPGTKSNKDYSYEARELLRSHQYHPLKTLLREGLALYPDDPFLMTLMADALVGQAALTDNAAQQFGYADQAIPFAQQAVDLERLSVKHRTPKRLGYALGSLARAWMYAGETASAIKAAHEARTVDPLNAFALSVLARLGEEIKSDVAYFEEARHLLIGGHYLEAEILLREGLALYPGDAYLHSKLADTLLKRGADAPEDAQRLSLAREAVMSAQTAVDIEKSRKVIRSDRLIRMLCTVGDAHYDAGDYALALEAAEEALRLDETYRYARKLREDALRELEMSDRSAPPDDPPASSGPDLKALFIFAFLTGGALLGLPGSTAEAAVQASSSMGIHWDALSQIGVLIAGVWSVARISKTSRLLKAAA